MGAKLSKIKKAHRALQADAASRGSQSIAADSLAKILPLSEESYPGSWRVFETEDERNKFIAALLVVLTENGTVDINRNKIDLYYTRPAHMQVRVVLAILTDSGIKCTHVSHTAGNSEKEAFRLFMGEIFAEFEQVLVGVARNVRRRSQGPVVTTPKLRHMKTQPELRPKPSRSASGLKVSWAATPSMADLRTPPPNKAPAGPSMYIQDRQVTVPASLAHRPIYPGASMMDLLENRYEPPSQIPASPYRMAQPSRSSLRVRSMQSVPAMRQPYMMHGALPEEGVWDEYGEPGRLSRQASFVTAPTHRLQHSRSCMNMPQSPNCLAGPFRLQHSQSVFFPTTAQYQDQACQANFAPPSGKIPLMPDGFPSPPTTPDDRGLRVVNGYPSTASGSFVEMEMKRKGKERKRDSACE